MLYCCFIPLHLALWHNLSNGFRFEKSTHLFSLSESHSLLGVLNSRINLLLVRHLLKTSRATKLYQLLLTESLSYVINKNKKACQINKKWLKAPLVSLFTGTTFNWWSGSVSSSKSRLFLCLKPKWWVEHGGCLWRWLNINDERKYFKKLIGKNKQLSLFIITYSGFKT